MPIVQLIIILIVGGVLLWLINTYIPMNRAFKTIINVIVVIVAIIFVLNAFGFLNAVWNYRLGR